jgi:hypothetical protein
MKLRLEVLVYAGIWGLQGLDHTEKGLARRGLLNICLVNQQTALVHQQLDW